MECSSKLTYKTDKDCKCKVKNILRFWLIFFKSCVKSNIPVNYVLGKSVYDEINKKNLISTLIISEELNHNEYLLDLTHNSINVFDFFD